MKLVRTGLGIIGVILMTMVVTKRVAWLLPFGSKDPCNVMNEYIDKINKIVKDKDGQNEFKRLGELDAEYDKVTSKWSAKDKERVEYAHKYADALIRLKVTVLLSDPQPAGAVQFMRQLVEKETWLAEARKAQEQMLKGCK